MPLVGISATVLLAVWFGTPGWWPTWASHGHEGEVLLALLVVVMFPVLLLAGVAWELRARPSPPELVAELSPSPIGLRDEQVWSDRDVLGSCPGGLITATSAHYGTVLVVEAARDRKSVV